MKNGHASCGTITSIGSHHASPNHLSVTVAHGKKRKSPKGMIGSYDDRPTSNFMVHKKHAAKYSVGQKVKVGMQPMGDEPEELF